MGTDGTAQNFAIVDTASGRTANRTMLTRVILFFGWISKQRVIIFLMLKGTSVIHTGDDPTWQHWSNGNLSLHS